MFVLYVLESCPYCINSLKILRERGLKHQAIIVKQEEKEYYKKQNKMKSFPQIFMEIDKDSYMKIGGNSDLEEIINHCDNISKSSVSINSIYYMYHILYGNNNKN
jgi:glutaredoxin